jgi:hypothetical protein
MYLRIASRPKGFEDMTERREYWDEKPAEQKMSSLADYLEDVRSPSAPKI